MGRISNAMDDLNALVLLIRKTGLVIVTVILAVTMGWNQLTGAWGDRYRGSEAREDWRKHYGEERTQTTELRSYMDVSLETHSLAGHAAANLKLATIDERLKALKEQLDRIETRQINGGR